MLTRKDFVIMAAEVANISDLTERKAMADRLAAICKADNRRFDRNRFMTACGL